MCHIEAEESLLGPKHEAVYTGPVAVNATETINAVATMTGYLNSSAATAHYTITP